MPWTLYINLWYLRGKIKSYISRSSILVSIFFETSTWLIFSVQKVPKFGEKKFLTTKKVTFFIVIKIYAFSIRISFEKSIIPYAFSESSILSALKTFRIIKIYRLDKILGPWLKICLKPLHKYMFRDNSG